MDKTIYVVYKWKGYGVLDMDDCDSFTTLEGAKRFIDEYYKCGQAVISPEPADDDVWQDVKKYEEDLLTAYEGV